MSTVVDAPSIGVAETTEEEKFEEPPEMIAHLYWKLSSPKVTHCGIPARQDPHNRWHHTQGHERTRVPSDQTTCPLCGAPICPECYEKGQKGPRW